MGRIRADLRVECPPSAVLGGVIARRHLFLGALVLALALVAFVVVMSLLGVHRWARVAAFALEGIAVVLALTRVATRPGAAIVSLALSAAVVALLLTRGAGRAFRGAA